MAETQTETGAKAEEYKRPRTVTVKLESPSMEGREVVIGVVKFGRWNEFKKVLTDPMVHAITGMMKTMMGDFETDEIGNELSDSEVQEKIKEAAKQNKDSGFIEILDPVIGKTLDQLDLATPDIIKMCLQSGSLPQSLDELDALDVANLREAVDETNDLQKLMDAEKKFLAHTLGTLINVMNSMTGI